jgi:hypothetical protein
MKTSEQIRIFSSYSIQFNHLKQCSKNGLKELRSQWRSFWCLVSFTSASTLQKIRLYATLGCLAGKEVYSNDRKFAGTVLLMVSLVFWWAHLFVDHTVVISGWHYKNWFFWFFTNREELTIGFGLLGFFLICPLKWGYKYALAPIIVYFFSEVVYQSLQISHWTHFYRSMFSAERSWQLLITLPVIIFSAIKVIDYIAYTKYHLKDGNIARLTGILNLPIPWEEKRKYLEVLNKEMQNFNDRV